MNEVFFDSWDSVFRVIITILFAYPMLILLLRISGKRSLSKLNMFDFIITIALGSVFGSVVILRDITVVDGTVTFGLLLGLQFLISALSLRWKKLENLVKAQPTLLYHDDNFLEDEMRYARVTENEILAAIRQAGLACMSDVLAVVLETNGELSVVTRKDQVSRTTLYGLTNYDPET